MQNTSVSGMINQHERISLSKCEYNFKWTLENFNNYPTEIKSGYFYPFKKDPWHLELYKFKHIELLLSRKNNGFGVVFFQCRVLVNDSNNKVWHDKFEMIAFDEDEDSSHGLITGLSHLVDEMKNTQNDTVEITLFIKIFDIFSLPSKQNFQHDLQNSLTEDLIKLYDNRVDPDVILQVQGEDICAHKNILSARSPVFHKMFHLDMSEAQSNVIEIKGITAIAFKELVAFIYGKTSTTEHDYQSAMNLYYAADMYGMIMLRNFCGRILASKLTENNAGSVLQLADLHTDLGLKSAVMRFICSSFKTCIKTQWWEKLMTDRTELSKELEQFLADFKCNINRTGNTLIVKH